MRVPRWVWTGLGVVVLALVLVLVLWRSARQNGRPPELVCRFVEGVDVSPVPMSGEEAQQVNDPWGALVLRQRNYPDSLKASLRALDELPDGSRHEKQDSYFVSESGELPPNAKFAREFRMAVSRVSADGDSIILFSAPAASVRASSKSAVPSAFAGRVTFDTFIRHRNRTEGSVPADASVARELALIDSCHSRTYYRAGHGLRYVMQASSELHTLNDIGEHHGSDANRTQT